ncbi:MAG: pilus assembly protein PilP [Gammaproteobacteria bacterium]
MAIVAVALSGCVSSDISDLEQWTQEVMSRPGGRIKPLPEIRPYEAYSYKSAELGKRNPFEPFYEVRQAQEEEIEDDGLTAEMEREIKQRHREELEQFELDSLRMVGTLDDNDTNWGIVRDPDGVVHRVKVGNYLGRNVGKIINIFEDRIVLREIVKNNQGRWEERQASIALTETES